MTLAAKKSIHTEKLQQAKQLLIQVDQEHMRLHPSLKLSGLIDSLPEGSGKILITTNHQGIKSSRTLENVAISSDQDFICSIRALFPKAIIMMIFDGEKK